jgi:hypothetical protein
MTGSADTAGTHAVGAIFGDTIQTNTVSTTFCNTVRAKPISATFCNTIQTNAISATFCNTVRADAICAIFSDYRGCRLLSVDLRQGESTGGQSGNNEAGEDLLFHVRSPEGGK